MTSALHQMNATPLNASWALDVWKRKSIAMTISLVPRILAIQLKDANTRPFTPIATTV